MSVEVVSAGEAASTEATGVCLDASVEGEVTAEVGGAWEGLVTHRAVMGLLPGVGLDVVAQVGVGAEVPTTVRAQIGAVTSVDAEMRLQTACLRERLVTHFAFEWFFSSVDAHV